MSRIPTPASIEAAPAVSQDTLVAVKKSLGIAPNLFLLESNSPAVLEGHVALNGALSKGHLTVATRERIALAVANINGCDYCNSAHGYLATNVAKLSDHEIEANRAGGSTDAKADIAVKFAAKVTRQRGKVSEADVQIVKAAGYSDGELLEIVAHVALNTLTNYVNEVFKTEIDFPVARVAVAA
jgi:uncharacterized peroxidase-related enzyme